MHESTIPTDPRSRGNDIPHTFAQELLSNAPDQHLHTVRIGTEAAGIDYTTPCVHFLTTDGGALVAYTDNVGVSWERTFASQSEAEQAFVDTVEREYRAVEATRETALVEYDVGFGRPAEFDIPGGNMRVVGDA